MELGEIEIEVSRNRPSIGHEVGFYGAHLDG